MGMALSRAFFAWWIETPVFRTRLTKTNNRRRRFTILILQAAEYSPPAPDDQEDEWFYHDVGLPGKA
jgi:hypothetical protein